MLLIDICQSYMVFNKLRLFHVRQLGETDRIGLTINTNY